MMDSEEELHFNAELEQHLQRVRHPRSGDAFIEAAREAIAAVDAGDAEYRVLLPGGRESSADAVVDGLDLTPFLADHDDEL